MRNQLVSLGMWLTLLLAAGLRFYRLAGQSLWSDEGNSVALARLGLAEIAARTAWDIHPPFYYWLLNAWMRVFGQGEVAVRSLSAVIGVLLVAVVYRLGSRLFNGRVGLLAAIFAAVSPFQVYYAQEARMYVLLALLGSLVVWTTAAFMSNEEPLKRDAEPGRVSFTTRYLFLPTRYTLLYVLSAGLGLYTHYSFPLTLVATNLAVLVWLWQIRAMRPIRGRLIGWLALQLIPLALYLPWLPVAWRQLTTWPALPGDTDNAFLILWRTLVLGPISESVSSLWLLGLGLLGLVGIVRLVRLGTLPKVVLMLLYLGLPTGLTLVLFKPAYLKFLLLASPALCVLLALGVVGNRIQRGVSWEAWVGAGLVIAAAWGPLQTYYADPAVARDDYRGMARYLEAVADAKDAIILNAAGQQEVFGYYYRGGAPVYPLPRRRPLDPSATVAELESITARSRRIFALYWATNESDPENIIEGWLDRQAFKATDSWVGNVRLVSYAAPLPADDLLPAHVRLGDHVTLEGYRVLTSPPTGEASETRLAQAVPGEIIQIQLRWTTDSQLGARYVVFLQALDEVNHLVGQRDAPPVISTEDWTPDQPVVDRHGLFLEPGTPPGEYRVIIGMYDAVTGDRLPTSSGDFVEVGRVAVEKPASPPPLAALRFDHAADVDVGPLRLLGYDRYKLGRSHEPDTPLHSGDALHVILYWQAQERPQTDWQLALQLAPVANPAAPVADRVYPAAGVHYPTTHWEPGEVVRAQFDIFLPGDALPGDYRVNLRLLDDIGASRTEAVPLLPISVE